MEKFNKQKHWENIYQTKELKEVSWYQPTPKTSLDFIKELNVPTTARIIDIGGGDSFLVDYLLELGYQDVSVLDISETAIEKAKQRLGRKAKNVKWIVTDITSFKPTEKYDLWHDRAAFHFLTSEQDISIYLNTAQQSIKPNGFLIVGAFSEEGPKKCSGIDIKQYSETSMTQCFENLFTKIKCNVVDHKTPFDTTQNFIFCSFKKETQ